MILSVGLELVFEFLHLDHAFEHSVQDPWRHVLDVSRLVASDIRGGVPQRIDHFVPLDVVVPGRWVQQAFTRIGRRGCISKAVDHHTTDDLHFVAVVWSTVVCFEVGGTPAAVESEPHGGVEVVWWRRSSGEMGMLRCGEGLMMSVGGVGGEGIVIHVWEIWADGGVGDGRNGMGM